MIRDKRRVDPTTGESRGGTGWSNPFSSKSAATDPGAGNGTDQAVAVDETAPAADDPEIARLAAELAERTTDLQRVTAEYANYRKRVDRDRDVLVSNAKAAVAGELLPVLDDLELARAHGDLTGAFQKVGERLISALERIGLQGFGSEGDSFDPAHHEAVQFGTSAEVREPTVTSVFRRGYSFNDRPLRAAVVVVTGPEHDTEKPVAADPVAADPAAGVAGVADPAATRSIMRIRQIRQTRQIRPIRVPRLLRRWWRRTTRPTRKTGPMTPVPAPSRRARAGGSPA